MAVLHRFYCTLDWGGGGGGGTVYFVGLSSRVSIKPYPTNIFFHKMNAVCVSCIYPDALKNTSIMVANTMNPDQTATEGAV